MELSEAIRLRIENLLNENGWNYNELIKRSKTLTIRTVKQIADGFGIILSQFFDDEVFR